MTADLSLASRGSDSVVHRRGAVLVLYGLSAFWGVAQVVAPGNPLLYILTVLGCATCATLWFKFDRRVLGKPELPVLQLLFFLTWPFASLLHLLITRGLRGIGYWLLHAVGLLLALCLTFFPTIFLLAWLGFLDLGAPA